VLEIVVDGLDRSAIEQALGVGIDAACRRGVVAITAGNYGGKLGKHHFHLHTVLAERSPVNGSATEITDTNGGHGSPV
jgi:formylmethanofuran--tetrahydromethanopterin N-formyltransferase